MRKDDIIKEIKSYIGINTTSEYQKWYVGITDDTDRRVFNKNEHNVCKTSDQWITCDANSKSIAQEIEKYFIGLGMDGDTGGGNEYSTIVYCYKKTKNTNP